MNDDNESTKSPAREDCLACIETACSALDGLQEYGIAQGDAAGLLVMHGLAMYARDTARAAVALLRAGQTLAAGALTRVVIEHAVLAQWLLADPEVRGQLFLQQSQVERARWFEVVLDANFDPEDPVVAALTEKEKRRGWPPSRRTWMRCSTRPRTCSATPRRVGSYT